MKASFREKFYYDGKEIQGNFKTIELPFSRVGARAVIMRKSDGAILGVLHRPGGKFAPPGGAVEEGETPVQAVLRELDEETIQLSGLAEGWETRIKTDYYAGYRELSLWFLMLVEDASVGDSQEIVSARWVDQQEDVWYPWMRENILILIQTYLPSYAKVGLQIR